jgi:hypothetical protein
MKGQPHSSMWCLSNILHEGIPAATNETTAPSPQTNLDACAPTRTPKIQIRKKNLQPRDQPPANPSWGSVEMTRESKSVAGAVQHTDRFDPNRPCFPTRIDRILW